MFIDPHGMHHGGLSGNDDRIQAMKELKRLSEEKAFQKKRIRLNGFILTKTSLANMPGAEQMDWDRLEKEYHVLSQDDPEKYLKAVFEM